MPHTKPAPRNRGKAEKRKKLMIGLSPFTAKWVSKQALNEALATQKREYRSTVASEKEAHGRFRRAERSVHVRRLLAKKPWQIPSIISERRGHKRASSLEKTFHKENLAEAKLHLWLEKHQAKLDAKEEKKLIGLERRGEKMVKRINSLDEKIRLFDAEARLFFDFSQGKEPPVDFAKSKKWRRARDVLAEFFVKSGSDETFARHRAYRKAAKLWEESDELVPKRETALKHLGELNSVGKKFIMERENRIKDPSSTTAKTSIRKKIRERRAKKKEKSGIIEEGNSREKAN